MASLDRILRRSIAGSNFFEAQMSLYGNALVHVSSLPQELLSAAPNPPVLTISRPAWQKHRPLRSCVPAEVDVSRGPKDGFASTAGLAGSHVWGGECKSTHQWNGACQSPGKQKVSTREGGSPPASSRGEDVNLGVSDRPGDLTENGPQMGGADAA